MERVYHKSSLHLGRIKCICWHNSLQCSDPAAKHWLQTSCQDVGSSCDIPFPLFKTQLHIGNVITHSTHKLYMFKDMVYYNMCGCRTSGVGLKKLSKPCEPPTSYGILSLNYFNEGELPPKSCSTARKFYGRRPGGGPTFRPLSHTAVALTVSKLGFQSTRF